VKLSVDTQRSWGCQRNYSSSG